jgi:hypothetical protein
MNGIMNLLVIDKLVSGGRLCGIINGHDYFLNNIIT